MRDMPFPFELEAKGGVEFLHRFCRDFAQETYTCGGACGGLGAGVGDWTKLEACFGVSGDLGVVCEPTSVLETKRRPSPSSASNSTLSSSLAGGSSGGGCESRDTAGLATVSGDSSEKWPQGHPQNQQQETSNTNSTENSGNSNNAEASGDGGMANKNEWVGSVDPFQQISINLDIGAGAASRGLDDWDNELLESGAASPGQDQSILRLIMGDGEDPSMGLSKLLQGPGSGVPSHDFHFVGGGLAGMVDQGFGLESNKGGEITLDEPISSATNTSISANLGHPSRLPSNPIFTTSGESGFPISLPLGQLNHQSQPPQNSQAQMFDYPDEKSLVLNHPQFLISQLQAQNMQNPSFFLPLPHNQLDQQLPLPPPSKRHNPGIPTEPDKHIPELGLSESEQLGLGSSAQQLHLLSYMQQRPVVAGKPKLMRDEMLIEQKAIVDQLYKAGELFEMGNPILAQEILARLNHQISPIGKPFYRVAFHFKEALRLLLMNSPLNSTTSMATSPSASPFNLLFKIGAYKLFSEISPLVQFVNFTCNQALLEALESFDRIHIVDFDIGYGSQWASLMQELALRKGGAPSLRITAFTSATTHDQLELGLARENLNHFAHEINMSFEFGIINLDYLNSASSWSMPFNMAEGEATVVNLPISSFCNSTVSPTVVLRFIKQLSPKIVVTVDRGCDRTDLPFAHHILQAFQSYLVLLESLDAVNVNLDALQKIETFLVRPGIEKLISGHQASSEKLQHWKALFLSSGFSPVNFSNFTECQAEWLLKRTLDRRFHVEKRQSSLVLYWHRKELISASAWTC